MNRTSTSPSKLPAWLQWTVLGRTLVFLLSATSIWSLLSEFYHLWSMQSFTYRIQIPATVILIVMALFDRFAGDGRLARAVWFGAVGGLLAAFAYDIFRIPFVVAAIDRIGPGWLRLPLFKVFPRFGALIIGQTYTQTQTDSQFTLLAHVIGWLYHFSNGATFGVMYLAVIGDARRRTWLWAVAMAAFLEAAMLFTPYTNFFGIALTTRFVIVTLTAHVIFGIVLGLYLKQKAQVKT